MELLLCLPRVQDVLGAAREAEYFAAVDEMAENAFDDQVGSCFRTLLILRSESSGRVGRAGW